MAVSALPNQYSTSDLHSIVIRDVSARLGTLTPMIQLFSTQESVSPGQRQVRLVQRNHLAQIGAYDAVANAGTSGYEPFAPGVGPTRTMDPYGRAQVVTVRDTEEYHSGDFSMAAQDIALAIGRMFDVFMTEQLEAMASTSVSYTTDSGAQTAYLLATSGAPWYTKNDTAYSNIIASALSPSTLSSARAKIAKTPNWYDAKVLSGQSRQLILMVPPEQTDLAVTITASQNIPLSLDSNVGDVYNGLLRHGIIVMENPLLTSTTRCYLFDATNKPFHHASFTPPKIKIDDKALPQEMTLTVTAEIGVEAHAFPTEVVRIGA